MTSRRFLRPALLATGLLTAALALQGCAALDSIAHKKHSSTFPTVTALQEESDLDIAWMPGDATDIRVVQSTLAGAADASVLLTSTTSALDPEVCAEVDRQSGPSYTIEGAPSVYASSTVFACGDWSVIAAPDGWFGWTPNAPDEAALSPAG